MNTTATTIVVIATAAAVVWAVAPLTAAIISLLVFAYYIGHQKGQDSLVACNKELRLAESWVGRCQFSDCIANGKTDPRRDILQL